MSARGQPREAIDVLTNMKGVHLDAEARSVLAHLWLHGVHDVDAAMPIYQALANQPLPAAGRTQAQLGVAECYLLQGQYDLARESLERIVSGRVHLRPAAQKFIGDSYLFQGDFEKATAEYKKVLNLSPSDESSNDALDRMILIQSNSDYVNVPLDGYVSGLKANLNGKLEEALRICRETIEAFPEALIVDDTWLLIGEIHKSQRRYGDAIAAYEKVVTEGSLTAAEGLNEIAVVYHRGLRDTKKSVANLPPARPRLSRKRHCPLRTPTSGRPSQASTKLARHPVGCALCRVRTAHQPLGLISCSDQGNG